MVGIAYLAIAARTLGPEGFGKFVLVLTYGQMIANFVQFQSWKGVIRYGALHVAAERTDRLERLFGFTATLDFGSALAGALLAIVGVPLIGHLFDWFMRAGPDAETGKSHLWHAACCVMFLTCYEIRDMQAFDDRP